MCRSFESCHERKAEATAAPVSTQAAGRKMVEHRQKPPSAKCSGCCVQSVRDKTGGKR